MAEVLLFHHAAGRTEGVQALATAFRGAGHTVHVPDVYAGRTFTSVEDGVAHAQEVGFGTLLERGLAAAEGLPADLVYAGISLGVMPAQQLAQTRGGARGALLLEACLPAAQFGVWPEEVPVQVHGGDRDPFFAGEGDLDAARTLAADAADGELFVYPVDTHLFTDASLPGYDAAATGQVIDRALALLARV